MRSLWSGVSGLRVHQIGMDVEGNNIANVNTYGFKYSRVNYNTMFSQTMAIATTPSGTLGGQNAMQIGLGVSANSTMRVHSQGSIQTTDRSYDVAINGNGYFLVSNDGGNNKYLTRDGSFNVDAAGNFVTTNGYVVQGWNRDPVTGRIDTTQPATNLKWDPAMTIPANPSSEIWLNASLNSGSKITEQTARPIYSLDSVHGFNTRTGIGSDENDAGNTQFYTTSSNATAIAEKGVDMGSVFTGSGDNVESINLRDGQGFWVSFADATYSTGDTFNGQAPAVFDQNLQQTQAGAIYWGQVEGNPVTLDITINGVNIRNDQITSLQQAVEYINTYTSPTDTRAGTGVRAVAKSDGSGIDFINTNGEGQTDNMKNISLTVNPANSAGERHRIEWNAAANGFDAVAITSPNAQGGTNNSNWIAGNDNVNGRTVQVITAHKYTYSSNAPAIEDMYNPDSGIAWSGQQVGTGPQLQDPAEEAYRLATTTGSLLNNQARVFRTTEDLRELLQRDARYGVDYDGVPGFNGVANGQTGADINENVIVTVNETGNFVISNPDEASTLPTDANVGGPNNIAAKNLNIQVTSFRDDANLISSNDKLANIFQGWEGTLNTGTQNKSSADVYLSSFGTSLQIFDSLGTQHNIYVEWTKHVTTIDGGNEWQMMIRVDEPATINTTGAGPNNIIIGSVRFGNDGSLISYDPRSINFSGNNGSAPNQQVTLNLGATGGFNGLVSNNQTSGISQQQTDGYKPGTLRQGMENTRIDQQGRIIGSFDNGVNLYLGQIALGNVTNDAGLEEIGSNMYRISSNSGTLTIGTSGTGGRGNMATSSIEMSNADLSLSLTNLIVIQRGYQASSKTITTSDQLLNTLINLKQ